MLIYVKSGDVMEGGGVIRYHKEALLLFAVAISEFYAKIDSSKRKGNAEWRF